VLSKELRLLPVPSRPLREPLSAFISSASALAGGGGGDHADKRQHHNAAQGHHLGGITHSLFGFGKITSKTSIGYIYVGGRQWPTTIRSNASRGTTSSNPLRP
jgi:hypothetical protein